MQRVFPLAALWLALVCCSLAQAQAEPTPATEKKSIIVVDAETMTVEQLTTLIQADPLLKQDVESIVGIEGMPHIFIRLRDEKSLPRLQELLKGAGVTFNTAVPTQSELKPLRGYVRVLPVTHISVTELAMLLKAPDGQLAKFLPKSITHISPVVENSLLVIAETTESLDQLQGFIRMLDKPCKRATIEMQVLEMTADAQGLGKNGGASYIDNPSLDKLLTTGKARVAYRAEVTIKTGGYHLVIDQATDIPTRLGYFDLAAAKIPHLQGYLVDELLIHHDNSATVCLRPILSAQETADDTVTTSNSRYRLKSGVTVLVCANTKEDVAANDPFPRVALLMTVKAEQAAAPDF